MCEYCHSFPHLPGCPNAPAHSAVYECEYCGRGIYPGDYYGNIKGDYFHWDCLIDMGRREILDLLGMGTSELLEELGIDREECKDDE